ncbi:phosphatase PAP2 family protein [Metabacillus sp. HB246100]|uniref:phosphatase PAP2 family protein n=1 Tax=Bacillus weihaiensis TaxID=1547283 RepID=UPI002353321B|nr:phosphatase PAP2 family protein [Bacillus weihaiensis]
MDKKLFLLINQLANKSVWMDRMMIYASNELRFLYPLAVCMLWIRKPKKIKIPSETLVSVLMCMLISNAIKKVKDLPRPFITRKANVLLPSKEDSSYISKHTILAYAVSTTIYLYNKGLGIFMYGFSTLIGISRVWTGVHYPFDILRSALLGSVVSIGFNRIMKKKGKWY